MFSRSIVIKGIYMNTIKFNTENKLKMVAHRGVSGLERENTCPAFVCAGVKSYYGIETDVHVTKDGRFIIHHDDTVKRLTGKELLIRETDFDILRSLRMLDTDNKTPRADLFLPTLEEYFAICRKYKKTAVLELKDELMSEEAVVGVAKAADECCMLQSTVFISFSKQNLLYLRKHFHNAVVQFLSSSISDDTVKFILENNFDADILHSVITKDFIDVMHKNGRVVNAWTVNTLEDATRLVDIGIDMITTNILE